AAIAPDNLARAAAAFVLQFATRCVYVVLAFAVAVAGRSTVAGLGAGLGYAFVESIATGILSTVYQLASQSTSAGAAQGIALALYRLAIGTNTGALTGLVTFRAQSALQLGPTAGGTVLAGPTPFDPPFAALLVIAYV